MTDNAGQAPFNIGDPVLADFNGAQVPGVIQDERDGQYQVRLAEPWADESGNTSDTAWLPADRLSPTLGENSRQALPS